MKIGRNVINGLQQIAEGGEGIIYAYHNDVLKVYKKNVNTDAKQRKVATLLTITLPSSVVAPTEPVYDDNNKFIGYIMPCIQGEEIRVLANNKYIKANNVKMDFVLKLLVKIHKALDDLHRQHIYIGDLNDQNILFNNLGQVYFIDCDSWTVGHDPCDVVMDLFRDPLMHGTEFTAETDTYAFSILIWKLLTRIHPFGGTTNPDMNILERMKNGISVIDNPKVKIPRTVKSWKNLSPELISNLNDIFTNKTRVLADGIEDMYANLKYCDKDQEYYYGKFNCCPLCDDSAVIKTKPVSQGTVNGLLLMKLLSDNDVYIILNENSYIDNNNQVVNLRTMQRYAYTTGQYVYFLSSGTKVIADGKTIMFDADKAYSVDIRQSSSVYVNGNDIYYISPLGMLTKMTVTDRGNGIKSICRCSYRSYYAVYDGIYCVINQYDSGLIICCNGRNYEVEYTDKIVNYGIRLDSVTHKWLVIIENSSGSYITFIFGEGIEFRNDQIQYVGSLANICISNNTIYMPLDGKIRGYSPAKQLFKDFECGVVTPDSKLIKAGRQFMIVNDENIYKLGTDS